jgi:hypothetical protein
LIRGAELVVGARIAVRPRIDGTIAGLQIAALVGAALAVGPSRFRKRAV